MHSEMIYSYNNGNTNQNLGLPITNFMVEIKDTIYSHILHIHSTQTKETSTTHEKKNLMNVEVNLQDTTRTSKCPRQFFILIYIKQFFFVSASYKNTYRNFLSFLAGLI